MAGLELMSRAGERRKKNRRVGLIASELSPYRFNVIQWRFFAFAWYQTICAFFSPPLPHLHKTVCLLCAWRGTARLGARCLFGIQIKRRIIISSPKAFAFRVFFFHSQKRRQIYESARRFYEWSAERWCEWCDSLATQISFSRFHVPPTDYKTRWI